MRKYFFVFALVLFGYARPTFGMCCVTCEDGIRICGGSVSSSVCGGCNSLPGGYVQEENPARRQLALTISIRDSEPRLYKIVSDDHFLIKDEVDGATFSISSKLSSQQSIELNIKRVFSVFGLQVSLNYASLKLDPSRNYNRFAHKIGPISILSARLAPAESSLSS